MKHTLTLAALVFATSCFGQEACPNVHDINSNGTIDIEDFLSILGLFADVDVDEDGVWDSQDDCLDATACNYLANPTEPCGYLDALGECGGACEGDGDGDGICDDVDTCVGELDECGVCNGPGPTEVVIEDIIITYDSIYLPVDDEWFVYAIEADTTFGYTCELVPSNCSVGSVTCTLTMYDAYGDGWNANTLSVNGEEFCFPDAYGDCTTTDVWIGYSDSVSYEVQLDLTDCLTIEYNNSGAYPSENAWELVDSGGDIIAQGEWVEGAQAVALSCVECVECGDFLSYQGSIYGTVTQGSQCWFSENLRSENYENGEAILGSLSASEWDMTTSGAVAVYGEGSSPCDGSVSSGANACNEEWSLNTYGCLYNWYSVEDPRGLCPGGWHVPTDLEWTVLTDHLGGALDAGAALKTESGWWNNGNGTNTSNFSAAPGGRRSGVGNWDFQYAGVNADFWSSSIDGTEAWSRSMVFNSNQVYRFSSAFKTGRSVRCIQDSE